MFLATTLLVCHMHLAAKPIAPATIPLYTGQAPGAVGDTDADKPTLTLYPAPADKATGAAVVICPGGGYGFLAMDHEGH
ncbi:MAG: alpha/beta hydrolase, partial [Gemmataceae bacterium]